jgi:hypothetical protein
VTGNTASWYAGVALRGGQANNIDDFLMTAFLFGPPPQDFSLLAPAVGDTGVAVKPTFQWEPASGEGTVYTVYVNTSASYAGADSHQVQTETTYVWPDSLDFNGVYHWAVRATDGLVSVFNLGGWRDFKVTAVTTPVELALFEATGDAAGVRLRWEARSEIDHLGYHVWRSVEEQAGYERITEELIRGEGSYEYVDAEAAAGQVYYYRLEAIDLGGGSEFFGPVQGRAVSAPLALALHQNVPNPFNPSTRISFDLTVETEVSLTIYDVGGRTVRRLVDGVHAAGNHDILWDGRADSGVEVGTGIYFYRLEVGDWSRTRKMMLIR